MSENYGRKKILTDMVVNGNVDHDKVIIPQILENALPFHEINKTQYRINKSWYYNDTDTILSKVKHIRPEIDNKFTFSTAKSVVSMNNGYCFGEPFKYVCNEADVELQKEAQAFNKCLQLASNDRHTMQTAKNAGIYGLGYKLGLHPTPKDLENGKFFNIVSDINNFNTFIVYQNNITKDEVLGTIYYDRYVLDEQGRETTATETVFNVWTKYHQWNFVKDNNGIYTHFPFLVTLQGITNKLDAFPLNPNEHLVANATNLPLQEYERTSDRVGDFELSIGLMDAINILSCCRLDSVQQSTDFIIKLRDIELGEFDKQGNNAVLDRIKKYMQNHFLAVESREDATQQPDIDVLDIPLNQSEVQQLQDYLYQMLEEELQQPTRNGGTGQDTGIAVENRNGFRQFENQAVAITDSAIYSERLFIEKLLEIGKSYENCPFKNLKIGDITINTIRNRSENTTTSVNNYRTMRDAGVNPYTAYSRSGLVADVTDTIALDDEWKRKEAEFAIEIEMRKLKAQKELEKEYSQPQVVEDTVDEPKTE